MEITKVLESYNPVFKRKELSFSIVHTAASTPKLYEVRANLAKEYSVNEDVVCILRLNTETGTNQTYGKADIYDSPENAKKIIRKYIQMRNMPSRREKSEQKETPAKTPEPKKNAEKPKKKVEEPKKE